MACISTHEFGKDVGHALGSGQLNWMFWRVLKCP
jgi:hypothetical protein